MDKILSTFQSQRITQETHAPFAPSIKPEVTVHDSLLHFERGASRVVTFTQSEHVFPVPQPRSASPFGRNRATSFSTPRAHRETFVSTSKSHYPFGCHQSHFRTASHSLQTGTVGDRTWTAGTVLIEVTERGHPSGAQVAVIGQVAIAKRERPRWCEGVEKKVVQRVSAGDDPLLQPGTTGPSLISSLG